MLADFAVHARIDVVRLPGDGLQVVGCCLVCGFDEGPRSFAR